MTSPGNWHCSPSCRTVDAAAWPVGVPDMCCPPDGSIQRCHSTHFISHRGRPLQRLKAATMHTGQLAGGRLPAHKCVDGHALQARRRSGLHASSLGRQQSLRSLDTFKSQHVQNGETCMLQNRLGRLPVSACRSLHAFAPAGLVAVRPAPQQASASASSADTRPPISRTQQQSPTEVADKLIEVFRQRSQAEWRKLIAFSKQWPSLAAVVFDRCVPYNVPHDAALHEL